MQEEIRRSTKDSSSCMHDEDNCALVSKVKKGKEKGSLSESSSSNDGKKVDKSKVRCFRCHELGHYATNCQRRNPRRDPGKDLKVRHLLHSLSWTSHSSHEWFHPWWEVVGFLTVELLST